MTRGWITQADRERWQRDAVRELAAILDAHPGLPLIAWAVGQSGGSLSGRIAAVPGGRGPRSRPGSRPWPWKMFSRSPPPAAGRRLAACPRPPRQRARHGDRGHRRRGVPRDRRAAGREPTHTRAARRADGRGPARVPRRCPRVRPEDPVFGGPLCLVTAASGQAGTGAYAAGTTSSGATGNPDFAEFVATADPGWRPRCPAGLPGSRMRVRQQDAGSSAMGTTDVPACRPAPVPGSRAGPPGPLRIPWPPA